MARSLFGLEAELAVSAPAPMGSDQDCDIVGAIARAADRTLVHLPGGGSNRWFLANGGLLYVDYGSKLEWATAECTTPWEAVAHFLAGQRLVLALGQLVRTELGLPQVLVCRNNVCYASGATFGTHESYLGHRPIGDYASWLIPHLASRLIYCGSGGLDPLSPGIRPTLLPRAAYIVRPASDGSLDNRGIFHTRDEALCDGYVRLHVAAPGDNPCSQRSTWLKVGATALVVALADLDPGAACPIELIDPVGAMKGFARDLCHEARCGMSQEA